MTKAKIKTEELRLKIAKKYCEGLGGDDWQHSGIEQRIFYGTFANHILKLCKDIGLVFVVKDAELPKKDFVYFPNANAKYKEAQQDMKDAGWEKTEEIETREPR